MKKGVIPNDIVSNSRTWLYCVMHLVCEKWGKEMTEKKYPCAKCKIKKAYAKMDFHWLDHEDCPYVYPFVKKNQDKEGGR